MSLGKYSPTVSKLYRENTKWHNNLCSEKGSFFDDQGYDPYGYDEYGIDRAGFTEHDYLSNEMLFCEVYDWCESNTILNTNNRFLRRCPMCGGQASICEIEKFPYPHKVRCTKCRLMTEGSSFKNLEYISRQWNRRI